MNILPKKRWHVRTKENIERVRRDEAQAAAEAKAVEQRALLAEQEARTSLLRAKARARVGEDCKDFPKELEASGLESNPSTLKHVNFFEDLEDGETTAAGNQEHENEKKKEQEEYEKKVGILTYLGQDSQELTGEKSWWQNLPVDRKNVDADDIKESKNSKAIAIKNSMDPLTTIRKYIGTETVKRSSKEVDTKKKEKRKRSESSDDDGRKHKRKKKHKKKEHKKKRKKSKRETSKEDDEAEVERERLAAKAKLEKLRRERIERERREKERSDILLGKVSPQGKKKDDQQQSKEAQKYSNQFNPHLANQNKLNSNKKYWLE